MNYIIWGAKGQAKVVRPILDAANHSLVGLVDRDPTINSPFHDHAVRSVEAWEELLSGPGAAKGFIVAIGGFSGRDRCDIGHMLHAKGLEALTAVHLKAHVASTAIIAPGCQILAGACISEEARIGEHSIINTNATVDHETQVGAGVHIMPGATVAGEVNLGDFSSIGSNATILPRVTVGAGAIVGAGAVVTRDVAPGDTVAGVPARPLRSAKSTF